MKIPLKNYITEISLPGFTKNEFSANIFTRLYEVVDGGWVYRYSLVCKLSQIGVRDASLDNGPCPMQKMCYKPTT